MITQLRAILLNNIGLKVLSLLLAFLLWLQVASQEVVHRTITIPVALVLPPGLEISNEYTKWVDVEIRSEGPRTLTNENQLQVLVDLSNAQPGTQLVVLTPDNIRPAPSGVEILKFDPPRIRLQLERTVRKIVQVIPEIVGSPAEGFEIAEVRVVPRDVWVKGPESRLEKVSTASTEPINVEGRTSSLTQEVFVDLEDPRLRVDSTAPVTVTVLIEEERREVRLRGVQVVSLPPQGVQISPRRLEVVGTVPKSFRGEIHAEDFQAVLEVGEWLPGQEKKNVVPRIQPPPELQGLFRVKSLRPEQVTISRRP